MGEKKKRVPPNQGVAVVSTELSAEEVRARLRPERVQEALAALPQWTQMSDGESLQRIRQFRQTSTAKAYVAYALEAAASFKLPVSLQWAGKQLVVTLRGFSKETRQPGITMAMVDLATALG